MTGTQNLVTGTRHGSKTWKNYRSMPMLEAFVVDKHCGRYAAGYTSAQPVESVREKGEKRSGTKKRKNEGEKKGTKKKSAPKSRHSSGKSTKPSSGPKVHKLRTIVSGRTLRQRATPPNPAYDLTTSELHQLQEEYNRKGADAETQLSVEPRPRDKHWHHSRQRKSLQLEEIYSDPDETYDGASNSYDDQETTSVTATKHYHSRMKSGWNNERRGGQPFLAGYQNDHVNPSHPKSRVCYEKSEKDSFDVEIEGPHGEVWRRHGVTKKQQIVRERHTETNPTEENARDVANASNSEGCQGNCSGSARVKHSRPKESEKVDPIHKKNSQPPRRSLTASWLQEQNKSKGFDVNPELSNVKDVVRHFRNQWDDSPPNAAEVSVGTVSAEPPIRRRHRRRQSQHNKQRHNCKSPHHKPQHRKKHVSLGSYSHSMPYSDPSPNGKQFSTRPLGGGKNASETDPPKRTDRKRREGTREPVARCHRDEIIAAASSVPKSSVKTFCKQCRINMAVKALKTDLALNNWKDPEKRISMQRISSTTLGVMFNAFIRSARESVKESPSDPRFQHLIRQAFSQMVDFVAETKAQETVPRSCADDRCAEAHWPDADRPIRFTNHSPDRRRAHKRQRH